MICTNNIHTIILFVKFVWRIHKNWVVTWRLWTQQSVKFTLWWPFVNTSSAFCFRISFLCVWQDWSWMSHLWLQWAVNTNIIYLNRYHITSGKSSNGCFHHFKFLKQPLKNITYFNPNIYHTSEINNSAAHLS